MLPPADAPDPALVARFCKRLTDFDRGAAVGIAFSGGPDSLALLLLAHAAWPGRVAAATVDHGLRPDSAEEAAQAAGICARLDIPHAILRPEHPIAGSLQQAARTARYALLEYWRRKHGLACVMTAHHADDQAETLIMRLNRGAGVGGLAGIRERNGALVRPVLDWRRAELVAIAEASGFAIAHDPSNADMRYDRARIRAVLHDADWVDVSRWAASALNLADAEAALRWVATGLAAQHIADSPDGLSLDVTGLPDELVRRLILTALDRLQPGLSPSGSELNRLIATLRDGNKASIGALVCEGGAVWRMAPAPPRRPS